MIVPEGNATYKTENEHGGRELSKRKRKEVQNSADSQRMWGEDRNIFQFC